MSLIQITDPRAPSSINWCYLTCAVAVSVEADNVPPLPNLPLRTIRENIFKNRRRTPSLEAQTPNFEKVQNDDVIYYGCNRPPTREPKVPLTLLHPVFGKFVDDCKEITPIAKDYACARELKMRMCSFYPNEGERRSDFIDIFNSYGIDIQPGHFGKSESRTDGHLLIKNHPKLVTELKNEIGWKGAEPSLEALVYYDAICRDKKLCGDVSTCHPCFIVFLAGNF